MQYKSTRDSAVSVTSAQAILQGISADGGLFVPDSMPWFSYDELQDMARTSFCERAVQVLGRFLTDYTTEELRACLGAAYTREKFETDSIAPIYELDSGLYLLELWHGPTCAFKDMALQVLPRLLVKAKEKRSEQGTAVILVATSGDTGKAALEGFRDVDGTRILVFYPQQGVSTIQKRQMATQEGKNVGVCAVHGNFDDAQTAVKEAFTDPAMKKALSKHGMFFSSANSINWGRLVPQVAYYVAAYCDLLRNNRVTSGEPVNVAVPTGNFGNILAAYYAKRIGIPIHRLICASNANNVLADFLQTGVYDRDRPFYTTISPSMDILVSSNLERLLYELTGCDDQKIRLWMRELSETGRYQVDGAVQQRLAEHFSASFCNDDETRETIRSLYQTYHYVCDPHTAVAMHVYEDYRKKTGDTTKTIVASTASPFKFADDVLAALGKDANTDGFKNIAQLSALSMQSAPKQLTALKDKSVRFKESCEKAEIKNYVLKTLGL